MEKHWQSYLELRRVCSLTTFPRDLLTHPWYMLSVPLLSILTWLLKNLMGVTSQYSLVTLSQERTQLFRDTTLVNSKFDVHVSYQDYLI